MAMAMPITREARAELEAVLQTLGRVATTTRIRRTAAMPLARTHVHRTAKVIADRRRRASPVATAVVVHQCVLRMMAIRHTVVRTRHICHNSTDPVDTIHRQRLPRLRPVIRRNQVRDILDHRGARLPRRGGETPPLHKDLRPRRIALTNNGLNNVPLRPTGIQEGRRRTNGPSRLAGVPLVASV